MATSDFLAMAGEFLNAASAQQPPANPGSEDQPTVMPVGVAPWRRDAMDPRSKSNEPPSDPRDTKVREIVGLLQDWSEQEWYSSRNDWSQREAAMPSDAQHVAASVEQLEQPWPAMPPSSSNNSSSHAYQPAMPENDQWWQQQWQDDETEVAKELGVPWQLRGPDGPANEPNGLWKNQQWREGSQRWGNRGGGNRLYYTCLYEAMKQGASKKEAHEHAQKMFPKSG